MEYLGSSVVNIRHIRHIFSTILRFNHMSQLRHVIKAEDCGESLLISSLVCQDTLVLILIDFFDQMLNCSFYGGGS